MKIYLNHVAILVKNIEAVFEKAPFLKDFSEQIKEFPSEGTRQVYISSSNQLGSMLIM